MTELLQSFLNPAILEASWPYLWQGLKTTLALCLIVVPLGVAGGALVASLWSLGLRPLRWALIVYVDFFRAFPPLVLLIFVYYGLPFFGVELQPLASVALALLLNTSSYFGEIFRAGIESIPRGQWEAARSTGLGQWRTLGWVILPQAARNVAPDLVSNTLEVIKLTSLASVVALPELLRMARVAQGMFYNPTPLIAAALLYLLLLWPLVRLLSRFERRMMAAR